MGLMPSELDRARRAARVREMCLTEFMRQAVVLVSDETLSTRAHESDPYGRRAEVGAHRLR
jgi:hypothetical protein